MSKLAPPSAGRSTRCWRDLSAGALPDAAELEHVDIKEEAGRRGSGGVLLAGQVQNTAAAAQLADEVACFANTPGGGALILGIENRTGDLLGTALDRDWLRHGIYTRVDLAPDVEEREVAGVRLLVLYVAPANEPVEDTSGRIRWRVYANCVAVDRAEWWLHRQTQAGYDSMVAADVMALPHLVRPGRNGWLYTPGEVAGGVCGIPSGPPGPDVRAVSA